VLRIDNLKGAKFGMTRMVRFSWSIFLLINVLVLFSAVPLFSMELDIARITQQAPYFDAYPGTKGIVWYRSLDYSLLPDGRMEKSAQWVILAKKDIPEKWLNWVFTSRPGGTTEVIEAGVYDPGTSRLIAPVIPEFEALEDLEIAKLRFPVLQDEFIIHLSTRQLIPSGCRINDMVHTGLDVPAWEQLVRVKVPGGSDLYYTSEGIDDPVKKDFDGSDVYEWSIVGVPAWEGNSLLKENRPSLVFSLRRGTSAFAVDLNSNASCIVPPVPGPVLKASKGSDRMGSLKEIIGIAEEIPVLEGLSYGTVRDRIPEKGPWTIWEKAFVLSDWLRLSGADVRLLWASPAVIGSTTPETINLFSNPVLRISPIGSKDFYYIPGQSSLPGNMPPSLRGVNLYEVDGEKVVLNRVPGGSPSENRIVARWYLDLDQDGSILGKIKLLSLNGWNGVFFGNSTPGNVDLGKFLSEVTGSVISGDVLVKDVREGYSIEADIQLPQAIMNAGRALVQIPGIKIPQLRALMEYSNELEFKFPFTVKEKFELSYPENADILVLPAESRNSDGQVSINESLSVNSRKRIVRGDLTFIVKDQELVQAEIPSLRDSIKKWVLWSEKTLPFKFQISK